MFKQEADPKKDLKWVIKTGDVSKRVENWALRKRQTITYETKEERSQRVLVIEIQKKYRQHKLSEF